MTVTVHRIAIVDDAPEVRALVRARLRLTQAFAVVAEGGTGDDAVRIAEELRPDLILLDVSMPGLGGLDAIVPIRASSPQTRVVLFSGFSEDGLRARALALGATAFVEKGATIDALVVTLLDIASRPPSPAATADGAPPAPPVAAAAVDDAPPVDAAPPASADFTARPAAARVALPQRDHGLGPAASVPSPDGADEWILTEHVERFRAVFDQAAIGIGTLTLTGQLVRANAALASLLDADAVEVVGVALVDLVPAADRDLLTFAVATAVQEGVTQVEHRLAGSERIVTSTLAAVRDSAQRPLYLLLQSQDVSAQRSTERALLESEERFRLLVESVADYAIFMLDREGRVASWNRGAERLKGYRSTDILGQHFRIFYTRDARDSAHPEDELKAATRDGRYQEEGWRVRKDGTLFWANVTITALRDVRGELVGFAKVTRDVTAHRQASQDLERTARELAQANAALSRANQRLEVAAQERADLLAIAAHELRSPLTVVSGTMTLLGDHWAELEEQERAELVASVGSSAAHMRAMLDELLLAARLDAGRASVRATTLALRPVLEAVVAERASSFPDLDVVVDCPADLEVTTDVGQLGQVVVNYLVNASRYGEGPVTVRASRGTTTVDVVVEDAGPGVPEAIADRLFDEMFLRGSNLRGTGMGLYIVRRLARALGGDAWYDRADGVTRFGLSLPAGGPPAP
ncbi:PAS domain S-box protein [Georgenia faecalis]|uniref:PAS domain S-box protein n=1 Tax=Georgenia faecalis TaxID=2483799 RepID=UPI000FD78C0B|nr:PAS domain S-box protein [Georgenia faecalis]